MKGLVFFLVPSLLAIVTFGFAYAESNVYQLQGGGAGVINTENPSLYTSSIRLVLSNHTSIEKGTIVVHGDGVTTAGRFIADKWVFSYRNDGSFHGEGPVQTNRNDVYNISLDGTRIFATKEGSMWKVNAVMQGSGKEFFLEYHLVGKDPFPTTNISSTATVLIPNGNSLQNNTGFFVPLNLEIIRGTTVVWENHDNIGHTIQSQDGKGRVIPMFNSPVLKSGETFYYKFDKPGVYYYFCTIHPWRIGIVTVT